jgi:hypothetical protein
MPPAPVVTRRTIAFVHAIVLLVAADATAQAAATIPRVRSESPPIVAAVALGAERSTAFRRLMEAIGATDGLVYVEHGECGRGVLACLHLSVVVSGPHRILRIVVSPRIARGCELTGSIGHELQHALEALSNPRVRSGAELFSFFHRIGPTESGTFETRAAVRMGLLVAKEACGGPTNR